jgi:hypothetical protein
MFRYKLSTLLILLALGPPIVAGGYVRWQRYDERQNLIRELREGVRESELRRVTPRLLRRNPLPRR